ncbi:MAG: hypothetical protein SchgKO_18930 [Schleiferiaceae bacterium]
MFVFFDVDSYVLTARDKAALDQWIKENTPLNNPLTIECHCDSTGTMPYNDDLSVSRAIAVRDYLVSQGVDKGLLATVGKGKRELKYTSDSDFYKNRRCEFIVPLALSENLADLPLEKGTTFAMTNLQFVGNQSIPMAESYEPLAQLLLFLEENPEIAVEIQGHVCCMGDQELSQARAEMVKFYLIDRGIHPDRLKARGFSNKKPLVKEVDEATQAINRRVEVKITSTKFKPRSKFNNSQLKAEMWTWEVYGMPFFKNAENLEPKGEHNLKYLVEMISQAGDYKFTFTLYEKRGNEDLLAQRKAYLELELKKMGVSSETIRVETQKRYKGRKFRIRNKDAVTLTLDQNR